MPRYANYSQTALEKATEAVRKGASLRQATRDWDVPQSTLRSRLRGTQPSNKAHSMQQRLTQQQEIEVANWIRGQKASGLPTTHAQIRSLVVRILRTNGDHEPLGKQWVPTFLARNQLVLKTPRQPRAAPLDSTRAHGVNTPPDTPLSNIPSIEIEPSNWVATPEKSQDVIEAGREAVQELLQLGDNGPMRWLTEKIGKRIDQLSCQLATAQAECDSLKQLTVQLKAAEQTKVNPEPNSASVQIEKSCRTSTEMAKALNPARISERVSSADFSELCSEWQLELS